MGLDTYWKKRDFKKTAEPRGKVGRAGSAKAGVVSAAKRKGPRGGGSKGGLLYIVQKHAATRLHYDFRLEVDGVLKSWAVPKGPSFDPTEKRLAVEVEDHPLEYGSFEGTIPEGEYGGGTVALWDRGEWAPDGDPREGIAKGKLKFTLSGEKLRGGFTLVRMGGRAGGGKNWLLVKESDDEARPLSEYDVTEEEPNSVTTGRSLDAIAEGEGGSGKASKAKKKAASGAKAKPAKGASGKAAGAKGAKSKGAAAKKGSGAIEALAADASAPSGGGARRTSAGRPDLDAMKGARRAPLPKTIEPQLATLVESAPTDPGWVYELKYDGYRVLAWLDKGHARFLTRNGKDWTDQFVALADAVESLPAESAVFDGEVVVMRSDGTTDFQALQNALKEGSQAKLVYFIFDLLYADGHDLRGASLADRKAVLASILAGAPAGGAVRFSDHVDADGSTVHRHACRLALEGVVAKRIGAPYRAGRGHDWLKLKCESRQEFLIGGFTEPSGSRTGLGAVLVGVQEKDGSLRYCGKVGTGFTDKSLRDITARLKALEAGATPFVNPPRMRGVHWVKPKLVCEIEFTAWTNGGNLRHPSFQGLREDKAPEGIIRENPQPVSGKGAKEVRERAAPISITTAVAARKAPASAAKPKATPKGKATPKAPARKPGERPGPVVVAGVTLSNPDKALYSEQGITKHDLALYYESVAEWMLPHVASRPLTLVRCPSGQGKPCFFQKHMGEGTPDAVRPVEIRDKGGPDNYLYIDSVEGLVSLVQMGALEMHVWGSHVDAVEEPDQIVIDLDPAPELGWGAVVDGAREVRERLLAFGLESFVKTTGGKGLHVVAPLERGHGADWDGIKAFTKAFAVSMESDSPTRYIANMSKAKRTDKIFIDYLRNGRGATAVCAYSTRAREGATVSTPIRWDELSASLKPADFNVETVPRRLARLKKDPWDGFSSVRQFITEEMKRRVGPRKIG